MPTVIVLEGYEIIVYWRNEHTPPHCHVFKADWEIRVYIGDASAYWDTLWGKPKGKELRRAVQLVADNLEAINEVWRQKNG
jgi:hypothetical protein